MINKVRKFIIENNIFKRGDSVILGVSGGADSMFMLYALNQLKDQWDLRLLVVHVNHHIRGEQAEDDARFVEEVCQRLGIPYYLADIDVPALVKETGMSEEEAGRVARYEIFASKMKEYNANKIAVAHNLNDNSETILFNLFRGTGIKGLTGIPVTREHIVRPIMCMTRDEIETYLNSNKIEYRVDATNKSTEYTRNKIRLDLIPEIKESINERADYNIVNAAENLKEISDYIAGETSIAYKRYVNKGQISQAAFDLHSAIFSQLIRMVIEEEAGMLKDITRTHINDIMKLKDMEVSKQIDLPYGLVAIRTYDGIVIKKAQESLNKMKEEILVKDGQILSNDKIEISVENNRFIVDNIPDLVYTKWIDYDKISELSLRNRRPGDYIIVDNKGSRKKLKDYFIDEKIPRDQRDEILLVADGNNVVWVVGYRLSSYYMINQSTKKILKLTLK